MKAWGAKDRVVVEFRSLSLLRSSFFIACVAYGMGFPFLISIRVYFKEPIDHRWCYIDFAAIAGWLNLPLCLPDGIYDFLLPPWKLPKILPEDSRHRDYTYKGSDREGPIAQLFCFPTQVKKNAFLDWIVIYGKLEEEAEILKVNGKFMV